MKLFVQGGLLVGFLVMLLGCFVILEKIEYFQNGIVTTARVMSFETERQLVSRRYVTVYYPRVAFQVDDKPYQLRYDYRQLGNTSPLAVGSTITIICTSKKPSKPYFGDMTQLVMMHSFLPVTGLVIVLFIWGMWLFSVRDDYSHSHPGNQKMEFDAGLEPAIGTEEENKRW